MTDPLVHLEREYDATITEVWNAWTDPVRLARWLGTLDGRPLSGDLVTVTMGDAPRERATIALLEANPPHSMDLAWTFGGEHQSVLSLTLEAVSDTVTRLVLEHRELGPAVDGYVAGWQVYLDGELAAELGGAAPVGTWAERFALVHTT